MERTINKNRRVISIVLPAQTHRKADYQEAEPKHLEQGKREKRKYSQCYCYSLVFLKCIFKIENYDEIYSYGDSTYIGPTYDMF